MKWAKYDYLCTHCDALIEATIPDSFTPMVNITCTCGGSTVLLSVEDATIHPQTTKGNTVDVTTEYNPNLLVTYKKIDGDNTSYVTDKVTQIEWDLDLGRKYADKYFALSNKIDSLKEQIVEWHNPNYDKQEVLDGLCEFFDINPTQTVRVEAQINVVVDIEVPLRDMEDFDASMHLSDYLAIDSNDSDTTVETWDVEHVNWDVQ